MKATSPETAPSPELSAQVVVVVADLATTAVKPGEHHCLWSHEVYVY